MHEGTGLDALQAFDLVGDGVLFVDDERRIVAANHAAAQLLGIGREELRGLRVDEIAQLPTDLDVPWLDFLREKSMPLARADGSRRFIEYRARPHVGLDRHLIVLRDVTERVEPRAELALTKEALAAKTELLEALLHHAPIGILIAEAPTGRLVSMNQAFERLWKGSGPDTPNVDAYAGWRLWNEDGSPRAPDDTQMARALRGETCGPEVVRFRRWDGVEGVMRTTASPVKDEAGRVVAAVAACQDITSEVALTAARNRLLQRVDEERAALRTLLMQLPVAAIVFETPEFRVEMVNEAYLAIIGQRDVVGKTLAEIHPDVSTDSIRSYLAKVCEEKKPQERREHRLLLPDPEGTAVPRYFTNTFQPLFDEAGDVSRIVATVMEVTHEVRARTLLSESVQRLRTVLDELPVGVNVRDAKTGEVLLSNKASARILGVDVTDRSSAASWRAWRARRPDGRLLEADELSFRRVMLARESVRNEIVLLRPVGREEDDARLVIRSSAALIKGEAGDDLVISVFEDITDEHDLLAQREETARFAEMFIGILAHDLRGPLNAITMAAGLLAARGLLDAGDGKRVRMITSSANRMADMVTQLLDLTRGRLAGGIPVERTTIDLVKVAVAVLDEIATSDDSIELRRELPDELVGSWDGGRLAQVVSNVVGNAVQHGDRTRPIDVRLRERGQAVELEVHSYGPPIPADLLPVLFDPFRRGERLPNTKPGGLGLGLYIAHEIIAAHGGAVSVRSTSDDGTTFTITLPRSEENATARRA